MRVSSSSILPLVSFVLVSAVSSSVGCGGKVQLYSPAALPFAVQLCALIAPCCPHGVASDCAERLAASIVPEPFVASEGPACVAAIRASASSATFCTNEVELGNQPGCLNLDGEAVLPLGETCGADDRRCAQSGAGTVECEVDTARGADTCQLQAVGAEGASPCSGDIVPPYGIVQDSVRGTPIDSYLCDRTSGLHCNHENRVCEQASPLGTRCGGQDYDCAQPAFCDPDAMTCQMPYADGAFCTSTGSCVSGDSCSANHKCTKAVPLGSACSNDVPCALGACVDGVCAQILASDYQYYGFCAP